MKHNKILSIYATWVLLLISATVSMAQWSITGVTQVTNQVLQYDKVEFNIAVTGAFTNPYDGDDIALDMILTSPTAKSITLPCYYVSGDATATDWKARFAPREAGLYTYHFELRVSNQTEATSSNGNFTSGATAAPGFLHKNNNWTFQFDNGKFFRGVGENVGWEPRASEAGGYKGAYTYEFLLPKLAANGVNFFRTWMSPWNLPLEWKKVTNTNIYTDNSAYFNPGGIAKLDALVDTCESLGLYMMLTLDYHGALSFNWNLSNYNSANGGPISTPAAFFTDANAKAMYKNRLRYLVARWGYSPAIGAWEFFNEIDNAMYTESNGGLPRIPDADVKAWHDEMSTYLKSIDPYEHLVTTSISHRAVTGMDDLPNIDINQKHIYGDPAVWQIDSHIDAGTNAHDKPYVIGEYGYRYQDDDYTTYGAAYDYDFKQGLWLGLFKATPVLPMSWWWEMFDAKAGITKYFRSVNDIYSSMMIAAGSSADLAQATVTASASGQKVLAVRAGSKFYIYILNTTNAAVTTNVTLSTGKDGNYTVQSFDPRSGDNFTYTDKGTAVASAGKITITGNQLEAYRERVLILDEEGSTVGQQTPYDDVSPVPGKIEAENFDKGGEGVAYHDLESANTGNAYRLAEGVDIEVCSDGGYNITDVVSGEWTEYTVDIDKAGSYNIDVRAAAATAHTLRLMLDGNILGEITVNSTGGQQLFQTFSLPGIFLDAGDRKVVRLLATSSGFSLDYLQFTLVNEAATINLTSPLDNQQFEAPVTIALEAEATDADGTISKVEFYVNDVKVGEALEAPFQASWEASQGTYAITAKAIDDMGLAVSSPGVNVIVKPSQVQLPFPLSDTPHAIPGKIEGENYDQGVDGIAYHDITVGNIKSDYRSDTDVDLEVCTDTGGGYNLADIQNGEWVEYTVGVAESGKYNFSFRVATQMAGQSFNLSVNDQVVASNISVPNTGGWQTWQTITQPNVNLTAGESVLRLSFNSEFFNLNYFSAEKSNVVTGMDEENWVATVVYPVPSRGTFSIDVPRTATSLQVVTINGSEIFHTALGSSRSRVIVAENLSVGFYTVIVQHRSGKKEFIKAIIIR